MGFIESLMMCQGGKWFAWYITGACRVTGGACDIYIWSVTDIRFSYPLLVQELVRVQNNL